MRLLLVALLPLLGVGCATTGLINAVTDPVAAEDHLGPIEHAYRTASNELVICMMENSANTEFNRPFRLQFPLSRCESATDVVIVPRRFLHKGWPESDEGLTAVPIAPKRVRFADLLPPWQQYLHDPPVQVTPGTVYNITYEDEGIFTFGYGSTTTTNLVVFHLKVRNRNMAPMLAFLPLTVALDIVTAPFWLKAMFQDDSDSDEDDYEPKFPWPHKHHRRPEKRDKPDPFDGS